MDGAGGSAAEPRWRHGIPRPGCRRRRSDRRTAQLPTRRGRSRAQARGRAAQGVGPRSRAAAAQRSPCSTRTRSGRCSSSTCATLQLVWRRGLGQRQELERALKDAGMQARLGSGERTPHPLLGIAGQSDRAMQERRCRSQAAARLRAASGLLERRGDRLAGPRCGCGQMPRATIGVDAAVGRLCQGQMDLPALLSGRCSVDSRAHQRMTEGHALSEREQPVRLRVHGGGRDPESLGMQPAAAADRRPAQPPRPAADVARRRRASRPDERSSPRSALRAPAPRRGRSRPPAALPSSPAGARATPADYRVSQR